MVFGVAGNLGGGKSLTCVRIMLESLRRGDYVTSNIKMKDDYLQRWQINASNYTFLPDFAKVDPWTLRSGSLRGSGGKKRSLIVVDEAGEWLDSYSDARHRGQLADIASWLRQSDKLGQDVYFIVQFENLLHNRLRSIVHFWIICQDFAKWHLPGFPLLKIPILSRFCVASFYNGRSKECVKRLWTLKSPLIYGAYETAAFFGNSFSSSENAEILETTGQDFSVREIEKKSIYLFLWIFVFAEVAIFCILVLSESCVGVLETLLS